MSQTVDEKTKQEIRSIRSNLSDIDSIISDMQLQKAEERLNKIESRVDSVAQKLNTNPRAIDELEDELENKREKISQRKSKSSQARYSVHLDPLEADSEAHNITSSRQSPNPKKQVDKTPSQHKQVTQNPSNNSEEISEPSKKLKNKSQSTQQQEEKSKFKEETNSIVTELSEIDSLESKLSEIDSLISEIDPLISEGEFQESESHRNDIQELRDEISSEISSLKQLVSQNGLDTSKSNVLTQLRRMDPDDFEEFVAELWRNRGWDAEVTSGSADKGIDIVATKQDTFEKRRHLIQVKRHGENTKVGSEDMQKYSGLYQRNEQVDSVIIVTSNQFTPEAKDVAKNREMSTVNADELYKILTDT